MATTVVVEIEGSAVEKQVSQRILFLTLMPQ
jgi:hypothetical protein